MIRANILLIFTLFLCVTFMISCKDEDQDATVDRFESELIGTMDMEVLIDNETNLVWVNDVRGCFAGIVTPTNQCEDLTFAGSSDWRTPTPDEMVELLSEISDRGMSLNYINSACALMSTSDSTVWVFTENSSSPGLTTTNKPGNAGLRCVRDN